MHKIRKKKLIKNPGNPKKYTPLVLKCMLDKLQHDLIDINRK